MDWWQKMDAKVDAARDRYIAELQRALAETTDPATVEYCVSRLAELEEERAASNARRRRA